MKLKRVVAMALIGLIALSGCGGKGEEEADGQGAIEKTLRNLEENTYYVLHQDGSADKVTFPVATFEQKDVVTNPVDTRIMWYADDYENIPTLYEGDSLIFYTKEEVKEEINFERFYDIGYTIGICKLQLTESGRYSLSTEKDQGCTYPNKDTDSILDTENKLVIVDTIGGVPLRGAKKLDGDINSSTVNRYGCITGLKPNNRYKAEVYSGTEQREYIFTSNIRAFGSMATTRSFDYTFEHKKVMKIKIPEYFNTGYYQVNGSGMFRYVKGSSYNEDIDFNVPNEVPESEAENNSVLEEVSYNSEGEANKAVSSAVESGGEKFSIYEIGEYEVTGEVSQLTGDGDGCGKVRAVISSPSKNQIVEMKNDNGKLTLSFSARETGVYNVTYYNLTGRKVKLSVMKKG